MSLIVAITQEGKIYMGSDSLSTNAVEKRYLPYGKIVRTARNDYLIGFSGSIRTANVLESFEFPKEVRSLPDSLKEHLEKFDCLFETSDEEVSYKVMNASLLVGHKGKLYELNPDFALVQRIENYVAVGDASQYAYGSLYTTDTLDMTPRQRIEIALKIGAHFSVSVGGTLYYEEL